MTSRENTTAAQVEKSPATTEARMDALLEAAVDAIISIDERGLIQMINPAAERLFGYSKEELLGRNVKILMPSPFQEEHDAYLARYLQTGVKKIIGIGREAVGMRKDGTIFPLELSVAEARLESTERIFVGIIRDISPRKEAEHELKESNAKLERVVAKLQARNEEIQTVSQQLWQAAKLASVGELSASIAHELNNPLATVSLRIESVLARTPADDSRRRALEIIQQETKRMSDLVASLLQFARRGQEQVSTVDVREELIKAVELIHHHLRKRQITVVQRFADTPMLYADRQKLRQVFLNILTNASDAMPQGGMLTLLTEPTTLPGGVPGLRIEIVDTGVGISSENLPRVMEPFFTTKEEGKGTGLGMAICRRIVQEHQGTIQITSKVAQGTTVRLLLPVRSEGNVSPLRTESES